MSNEEKAKEIVKNLPFCEADWQPYKDYAYDAAIQMAQWKDREIAMLLLNINDMIADCKGHECITFISDYLKMICEKYCKEE